VLINTFCPVISQNTGSHETNVLAPGKWMDSVEVQEVGLCFRGSRDVVTSGNKWQQVVTGFLFGEHKKLVPLGHTARLHTKPASLELDAVIRSKNLAIAESHYSD
jgi:hypothetical protein